MTIKFKNLALLIAVLALIGSIPLLIKILQPIKQVMFIHTNRQIDLFADDVHFEEGRVIINSHWDSKATPIDTVWTPEEIPSLQQTPLKNGALNGYVKYLVVPVKTKKYQISFPTADIKELRIQKWHQASRSR